MSDNLVPAPHKRRPRYSGKNPRRFEEKYKEHNPGVLAETVEKVLASGKTPAGTHRPIMVAEILAPLAPSPANWRWIAPFGYGGHAREILQRIAPGGHLLGLDTDPIELPKTEARLRAPVSGRKFSSRIEATRRVAAGACRILLPLRIGGERAGVRCGHHLADLGVSSMQIDDPARGFSVKFDGPLDMRMNPQRGQPASAFLAKISPDAFAELLIEYADEPHAAALAPLSPEKLSHHQIPRHRHPRRAAPPGQGRLRPLHPPRLSGIAHRGERRIFSA